MFKSGTIKCAFIFVGTLIGAGFASGKEILIFFEGQTIFAPILSCIISALAAMAFYVVGISHKNLLKTLFKRSYFVVNALIILTNFIIFATMIAAANTVSIDTNYGENLGILLALIALAVVVKQSSLGVLNTIIVPLIVTMIWVLMFCTKSTTGGVEFNITNPILYATFNLLSAGLILAKQPYNNKNTSVWGIGLWIAIILLALVIPIYYMVQLVPNADMPLQAIAASHNLTTIGNIIILLAILTTATSSLQLCVDKNIHLAPCVTALAMLVSAVGFNTLTNSFYPLIGILGCIITVFCLIFLCKNRKTILKTLKLYPSKPT
ncbi:MAG: hypothetical protein R3Y23_06440 [Bacillota bacterium]